LAEESTCNVRKDVNAKSNANYTAAGTVNFASHGRTEKLHEHGERIQAEGKAANWRRQERRMVRLSTGTSNFLLTSVFFAQNVYSDANLAAIFLFSIIVEADHVDPERVFFFIKLPSVSFIFEVRFNLVFVVGLGQSNRLFGESTVFK
jgi:hypothetical protein